MQIIICHLNTSIIGWSLTSFLLYVGTTTVELELVHLNNVLKLIKQNDSSKSPICLSHKSTQQIGAFWLAGDGNMVGNCSLCLISSLSVSECEGLLWSAFVTRLAKLVAFGAARVLRSWVCHENWSVTFTVVKHYLPEVDWQRSCSMLDPCQIEFAVRVALWPVVWTVASVDYHLSYLTLIWRHSNLVFSVFLTRARHSACLTQTLLYPLTSSGWLGVARCLLGFIIDHLATVQMPKRCDLTLFVECREVERKETNETMLVGNKNAPRGIVNVVNQNSLTEYP